MRLFGRSDEPETSAQVVIEFIKLVASRGCVEYLLLFSRDLPRIRKSRKNSDVPTERDWLVNLAKNSRVREHMGIEFFPGRRRMI